MDSVRFLLVSVLLLLLAFHGLQPVRGNAELRALMELKSSLDPEDKVLGSWTNDGEPCLFEGIACNEHRKVANISLQGKGLSGWLSPVVAELKCLSGLYLHYNNLSGEIPSEISNLTDLVDLYLDFNNLTGNIPPELSHMPNLQVLQLGYNQLVGTIPKEMGSLKQLTALELQCNKLSGTIPLSLGNLEKLRMLNLSFNSFNGSIPATLADLEMLRALDIRNNSLSGRVPSALKTLRDGFQGANNLDLCGHGFSTLKACSNDSTLNSNQIDTSNPTKEGLPAKNFPEPANVRLNCNQTHCSKSRMFPQALIASSVITTIITFICVGLFTFIKYRRQRQRITNSSESSEGKLSPYQPKELYKRSPSPLVNLNYYNGWDPNSTADAQNGNRLSHEYLNRFRFTVDEIESATQYFSEANLLSKSKLSAVYKGILRDGSLVAIRSINVTCCKTEEAEFVNGLNLVLSLRHENLVRLRGFCCSASRGECFLVYDFAPKGDLSQYLDLEDGSGQVLEWTKRVSIIKGIAKGIGYLHSNETNKPTMVHQNLSVEKVVLDHQFSPLIMDSGLPKLLADDAVFSALKVSAAMGYLAPEYITTGRFTEKSDIYAFGVIILQVVSGKTVIGSSIKMAVESFRFEDFVDSNLKGRYAKSEAAMMAKLALMCTHELPDQRPTMVEVIQEMHAFPAQHAS
ncbi:hypothetical protein QN277_003579 [Acacia crassicarpa]|uniref:Protein kinase domain-containing protein n=1 Tax=Acacia crassicarpa TaxID=499986 RepID=A0AAE1J2G1_9FABA|nr:hypothetical protein QN277_003579 [Acacia crassicarpa]